MMCLSLQRSKTFIVSVYVFRFVIPVVFYARWGRGWVCQNTTVVVLYLLGWLWRHVSAVLGHLQVIS